MKILRRHRKVKGVQNIGFSGLRKLCSSPLVQSLAFLSYFFLPLCASFQALEQARWGAWPAAFYLSPFNPYSMSHLSPPLQAYLASHDAAFLDALKTFLRIPSVGALKRHYPHLLEAAEWLAQELRQAGLSEVRLLPTQGQPLVYAHHILDPSLPTILFYGHYDVQPASPEEAWTTPAFEPTLREKNLFARGASDDKGQVLIHVKALEAMLACGELPCNVKCLIEGEEEIGSPHLKAFLKEPDHQALLAADVIVVSDTSMPSAEQPVIPTGLRGITTLDVMVQSTDHDLHSGVYGGTVQNPIDSLCQLISGSKIAIIG